MPIYIWYPSIAGIAMGFVFMNIPPVADQFMAVLNIGYDGLALFLSGVIWSHSLSQIPAGMVVDRLGVFRLLLLASGVGTLCNFLPLADPSSLALAISCRFGLGLCTGLFFLALLKIMGFLAPPAKMARAQGIYGAVYIFGMIVPYLVLPRLGPEAWQHSYAIGGCLFLVSFFAAFLLPREKIQPPRAGAASGERLSLGASMRVVAGSKAIWALGIVHGFSYGTMNNLGQWLPSLLSDLSDGDLAAWALAATLVLLLGCLARWLSGSVLRLMTRSAAITRALLLIAVFYILVGASGWVWSTLAVGLALAFMSGINYGSIFTLGSYVLPAAYMATALGLMNMIANLTNAALTVLLGYVREHTGSFRIGFATAGVVAFVVWLGCRRLIARVDGKTK